MIDTTEASLLKVHQALTEIASSQLSHAKNFQGLISYYNDIILCMPGNVYWLDKDCMTIGCNQNVLNMLGLKTIDEFVGLSFEDMARIGNWAAGQAASFKRDTLEVVRSGQTKANVEEPPITYADGRIVYFLTTRVPLFNGRNEVIGVIGISTDITERKLMENALIVAKEKAEVANQAKKQFLYNMRHDIRTPFGGIVGVSELLQKLETDPLKKNYIDTIFQSSVQLLDYLNDILDSAHLEDGGDPIISRVVNIKQTIEDCVTMFLPSVKEKKQVDLSFEYDKDLPESLITDQSCVKRILINLLGNAVKFTHEGAITITLALERKDHDSGDLEVIMTVSDTGVGIPRSKQQIIFEKFERLTPAYEGRYKGTGLGLFVVKSLVHEMGGEIRLESEPGKGSAFSCVLPMRMPNKFHGLKKTVSKVVNAKPLEQTLGMPRLLLVEDDSITQLVISGLFESLRCTLDVVPTAQKALQYFREKTYDLVIMDIGLPDMDGYMVTKKMRDLEMGGKRVPIVALTAHAKDDIQKQCLVAGMDDVLSKPLTQKQALNLLTTYI